MVTGASFDEAYRATFDFIAEHSDEIAPAPHEVVFSRETIAFIADEIAPMLARHWRETAVRKDVIKLDPDWDKYRRGEAAGSLRIYTAREAGELIGYAVFFVQKHHHYRTKVWAFSDIFYIDPDKRRNFLGSALIDHAEEELRNEGVDVVHIGARPASPAAFFAERLGYEFVEVGYAKHLSEGA